MEEVTVHCDGQKRVFKVQHTEGRSVVDDRALLCSIEDILGFASTDARECMGLNVRLRPGHAESVEGVLSCLDDQGYTYIKFESPL